MSAEGALTRWLRGAPTAVFVAYAVLASFTTYFAMYAFRKPFAAASSAEPCGAFERLG